MSIAEQVKQQLLFTVTDEDKVRVGNTVRENFRFLYKGIIIKHNENRANLH